MPWQERCSFLVPPISVLIAVFVLFEDTDTTLTVCLFDNIFRVKNKSIDISLIMFIIFAPKQRIRCFARQSIG